MEDVICILEDSKVINFLPLVYLRPVYDLRCGINTLKEKITREYPDNQIVLHCRKYLNDKVKCENPSYLINEFNDVSECLFVNGRVLFTKQLKNIFEESEDETIYFSGDNFVAAKLHKNNFINLLTNLDQNITKELFPEVEIKDIDAELVNFSWDLITKNGSEIINDFEYVKTQENNKSNPNLILLNREKIKIGKNVTIKPNVILDAEDGPIFIDDNVTIMSNTVVEGPCFIGKNTKIKISSKIYQNSSIGEFCKVGGEIENSILHSFANKQHDGFLGHSYISQWCNLGADTNTSDLKNNYSNIKVQLHNQLIDTKEMFLGIIMGDHSKSAINTMFNTGSMIGISSNIFDSGFPPKFIPSFSWGGLSGLKEYELNKAVETAKIVYKRRDKEFTEIDEKLFEYIFYTTNLERDNF